MAAYKTIKELVLDAYASSGKMPSYEKLTSLVLTHFPSSKWQKPHYAWYKSQIQTGKMSVSSQEASLNGDETEPDVEQEVQESLAFSVSMEKDLRLFVSMNLALIEPGLVLHDNGVEFQTDVGRIDLLALDNSSDLVVLELKAGRANDATLGQILGYMGALGEASNSGTRIRGIIVASDFDSRIRLAAKHLSTISLVRYELAFQFETVT